MITLINYDKFDKLIIIILIIELVNFMNLKYDAFYDNYDPIGYLKFDELVNFRVQL